MIHYFKVMDDASMSDKETSEAARYRISRFKFEQHLAKFHGEDSEIYRLKNPVAELFELEEIADGRYSG